MTTNWVHICTCFIGLLTLETNVFIQIKRQIFMLLFGLKDLTPNRRWFGCDALFGDDVVSFGLCMWTIMVANTNIISHGNCWEFY